MPRHSLWPLLLLMVLSCSPYDMGSSTYVGFSIGISNAPPAPRVVFVDQPDVVIVPGSSVYVVQNPDYDVFRYGGYFYLSSGGYWYRSRSYDQPFAVCDVRTVPRPVLTVPARHWKHHPLGGPPGHRKREPWTG
jgi:hypothetical protein